ncbi:N-acetylmuramoyl-L-alanine amidase [Aeromicrobium sp. CTD01-1L150]|uniref:N-acetylmuramoyl-L-alanine amidase n=1 Tax=Aeromicrobium sp. CTD01-1L150 TaxID=3341830 RepID=UPI0035C0D104
MRRTLMRIGGAVPALAVAHVLIVSATVQASADVSGASAPRAVVLQDDAQAPSGASLQETALETTSTLSSQGQDAAAVLQRQDRDAFELVGVTWEGAEDVEGMRVRTQVRQDGEWSEWIDLEVDETGAEGDAAVRAGTDPVWVGESDGVSVRVDGLERLPEDLKVVTVDGGEDPVGGVGAQEMSSTASAESTGPPRPSVISRSSWGAGKGRTCDKPVHGKLRGVMIHHTAGSNSYAKSESASIVRSMQSYHVRGQGWCDIGYNFLVDKYGQIFEGRKGGWTRMVRGAHAGSTTLNRHLVGISMMGNYDEAHTSRAQRNAVVRLVAWRLGSKDIPAKGRMNVGGHNLHRISMHRNVSATACPGKNGVNWVKNPGGLRDRAAKAIADAR